VYAEPFRVAKGYGELGIRRWMGVRGICWARKDVPNLRLNKRKGVLKRTKLLSKNDTKSFYDIYTYLTHVLLRQDKAGMAANLENRVPFLYEPVVQYGFNLNRKIGKLGGKTPLKRIALKYLPKELVLRKKCGFGLPIADWLRDKDALLPKLLKMGDHRLTHKYLNAKEIKKLIDEGVQNFV
jgi:asparagine synthase (glutamine-hydrolysing)